MKPIKFVIVLDVPPAIDYMLDTIRAIVRRGEFIKLEISTVEEEEE